ncbi:MAG: phosphoribosylanthranilate isomerase [Candidatus Omnitrophota bacterium]|nr:phosphoribosylanthranilate isomerase [Candidatus Omnitrophota bacterium]MDZ4242945.1 phosphoribosylanthranilate isomerase [Candidatus Omnitrophota bacterium]
MIRVKICGITTKEDALKAASLGAWAVGFIFHKKSPRYVGPFRAKAIIDALPPFVTPVGVFVDQKEGAVRDIAKFCGIRTLQFHGDETPEYCKRFKGCHVIKAFRVGDQFDVARLKNYHVSAFLFDAHHPGKHGGTGQVFDWSLLTGVKNYGKPAILSGGLNAQNVTKAVEEVRPFAVDVSSGVEEAPGRKSEKLMKDFISRVYIPV